MATLRLGSYDNQKFKLSELKDHLKMLHRAMSSGVRQRHEQMKDNGKWYPLEAQMGDQVKELQEFLKSAGFMPHHEVNGIFDYFTLASLRLFQEYVYTVEGLTDIGKRDGIKGSNTQKHIDRWKASGKIADWGLKQVDNPTSEQKAQQEKQQEEFDMWINLMERMKQHYLNEPHPILKLVNEDNRESDTFKVSEWSFDSNETHLIGVRCKETAGSERRVNDDIFILLVNGVVFKFWGSTDPSARMAKSADIKFEAFLVEGQHNYRFGWHKISNAGKIYQALRPANKGVLVFRDFNEDNKLDDADIAKGLQAPNQTINIHWSGIGSVNFSAGCQVIAAESYVNHKDEVIEHKDASKSYAGLTQGQTKGAYNVLADLIAAYSPRNVETMRYTLGRDDLFAMEPKLPETYAEDLLKRLK